MYYYYWYFKRKGIPATGFPLPFIGTLNKLGKALKMVNANSKGDYIELYWESMFGEKLPPIFIDFRAPHGVLMIQDPIFLNELYVSKNKFFDKHDKPKRVYSSFIGNSILFDKSNELWSTKRKHLSAAFYKEKMTSMLKTIMSMTNDRVSEWK